MCAPAPPVGLDPRTCILCATFFSIVAACLQDIRAALAALGIGFCCLAINPGIWRSTPRRLAAVNVFILFIWLVTPFSTPGEAIWQWHFLRLTDSGIRLAILATLKANALAAIFISLIAPLPAHQLDCALSRLHCPDKLCWIFLMLGQNIHILQREWISLVTAAKLRGFAPNTSLHTYRTTASMLAILLLRARDRATRLREAMLLKGFTGHFPHYGQLRYGPRDACFFLLTFLCAAVLILLESGFPHA